MTQSYSRHAAMTWDMQCKILVINRLITLNIVQNYQLLIHWVKTRVTNELNLTAVWIPVFLDRWNTELSSCSINEQQTLANEYHIPVKRRKLRTRITQYGVPALYCFSSLGELKKIPCKAILVDVTLRDKLFFSVKRLVSSNKYLLFRRAIEIQSNPDG